MDKWKEGRKIKEGRMDGRKDGWMDGWKEGRMDGRRVKEGRKVKKEG
jgi:hypothetical protein